MNTLLYSEIKIYSSYQSSMSAGIINAPKPVANHHNIYIKHDGKKKHLSCVANSNDQKHTLYITNKSVRNNI